jgi:hypothetical protein
MVAKLWRRFTTLAFEQSCSNEKAQRKRKIAQSWAFFGSNVAINGKIWRQTHENLTLNFFLQIQTISFTNYRLLKLACMLSLETVIEIEL